MVRVIVQGPSAGLLVLVAFILSERRKVPSQLRLRSAPQAGRRGREARLIRGTLPVRE
jgi:hypothetical protein